MKIFLYTPTECPICGEPTKTEFTMGKDGKNHPFQLICTNKYCGAKIEGRLLQFLGPIGLDVESISTATVKDLIYFGWLKKMSDVFTLKDHREEWIKLKGYGESSVDKILDGIPSSVELWRIIASIGIPNVEKQTSMLLADKFQTWENFINAVESNFDFSTLSGIGPITAKNIQTADYSEICEVMKYITIKQKVVGGKLDGLSFCITGKLSVTREELVREIEKNGGKFASVSKGLNYLICNDKTSNSGKSKKAKDLGIPVITEDEFKAML